MAQEEHIIILKQGVEVWNQWREKNPEIRPDLYDVYLPGAPLSGVNLRGAFLNNADLRSVDLREANLTNAVLIEADMRGASLREANLSFAELMDARMSKTNLCSASFSNAVLSNTVLSGAALRNARLPSADLSGAYLYYTDLRSADLRGACLFRTVLSNMDLGGADFSAAIMGWTVFSGVDLSEVIGLDSVEHHGPSYIDIQTIYKSQGNIPEVFLRGAGVPDNFITYMKSLTGTAFDFYSCFISYSSQDKPFVERLYADLQAKGVRCWYAAKDLQIGEPYLAGIDRGIQLHEKLLLVLSEHSIASNKVAYEVEAALAEEVQPDRKTKMLFPIRLDNAVMETNIEWAERIRQKRQIGDFTCWKDHDAYQKAFDRLLRDLKAGG
mgnify:CR=1 FL=1